MTVYSVQYSNIFFLFPFIDEWKHRRLYMATTKMIMQQKKKKTPNNWMWILSRAHVGLTMMCSRFEMRCGFKWRRTLRFKLNSVNVERAMDLIEIRRMDSIASNFNIFIAIMVTARSKSELQSLFFFAFRFIIIFIVLHASTASTAYRKLTVNVSRWLKRLKHLYIRRVYMDKFEWGVQKK